MKLDKVWYVLSDETQEKIKRLIVADIKRLGTTVGLQFIEKDKVTQIKEKPKARGGKRDRVEIPTVFGRKFPSVKKLAEYYSVTVPSVYYWIDKGYDLEDMIKEKGKIPQGKPETVLRRVENGQKIYKL